MKNRHRWILMLLALCSAALLTGSVAERRELAVEARVDALQEDLAGEVFRFHVIANSDSPEDQALKLEVRDRILERAEALYPEHATLEEARRQADSLSRENGAIRTEIEGRISELQQQMDRLDRDLGRRAMLDYAKERMEALRQTNYVKSIVTAAGGAEQAVVPV